MQSLGVRLRLERERQKLGIVKIADDTCISKRYIEAIEADDQASLPGEFFYRAFVRQYSKYLGWDPDEIEKQINLVSTLPNSEPVAVPAAVANPVLNPVNAGDKQQTVVRRETLTDRPSRDEGMSRSWLVFAALVIVGCIAYFMWPGLMNKPVEKVAVAIVPPVIVPPAIAAPELVSPELVSPNVLPETKPMIETEKPVQTPVQTPVPTPSTVDKPKTDAASTGAGQSALTVRAKQTTWISLKVDGATLYGGTISAGQERSFNGKDIELVVGNAGTLDVIFNGKVLNYGGMGEVKTLLMNPEGWKFKPKPMPEPGRTTAASATKSSRDA